MLIESAEPFLMPAGPTGCLLIHGYASTPREWRWMGTQLQRHGYTVLAPRLFGHATRPADLRRARAGDWLTCVEDGYHLLRATCRRVVAIGLSLGGALVLRAAAYLPFAGVIALSTPASIPPAPRLAWLEPLLAHLDLIAPLLPAVPKPPPLGYADPLAGRSHLTYPTFATRSLAHVARLVRRMRAGLGTLHMPVLLLHARQDPGVHPANARQLLAAIGSRRKELAWIDRSGHVIPLEPGRTQALARMLAFLSAIAEGDA